MTAFVGAVSLPCDSATVIVMLEPATARVKHRGSRRYRLAIGAVLLVLASSLFGFPSWATNCYGYNGGSSNASLFWNSVSEWRLRICITKHGIDAKDHVDGLTPLHWAAWFAADPAVIAVLIEAGAELEGRDDNDWTPLQWASFRGKPAVVTALIEAGADLEPRDDEMEWTLLHFATGNRYRHVPGL